MSSRRPYHQLHDYTTRPVTLFSAKDFSQLCHGNHTHRITLIDNHGHVDVLGDTGRNPGHG